MGIGRDGASGPIFHQSTRRYNTFVTSHETRFRVRYAETDQMGVVYYANYLVWMEVGRAEFCRAAGICYRDMEAVDGLRLAVVDAHCRYLQPARYDDEIVVATRITRASRRIIEFQYEIRQALSGRAVAEGETKHIFLGHNMKPAKLPEKYYASFGIKPPATD
jgi:acyl-CoA thioester hydrolase